MVTFFQKYELNNDTQKNNIWMEVNLCRLCFCIVYQSESRLDNGVISINLSRTFFTGIGHVLEYIDQVLKIHSF